MSTNLGPFINQLNSFSPNRSTIITADVPDFSLTQEAVWKSFVNGEITSNTVQPATSQVVYRNGIGFQLLSVQDVLNYAHDAGQLDSALVPATVPDNFSLLSIKRSNTDLVGIALGTQVATGDMFYHKPVAAGDDWSGPKYQLGSDYTSFGPPSDNEFVPLDRVFLGSAAAHPDNDVFFRFFVPGLGGAGSIGALARMYFVGIPSTYPNATNGTGHYACTFFGDGSAYLWEKGVDSTWVIRLRFTWSEPHRVAKANHFIGIRSDAHIDANGNWAGSVITIQCASVAGIIASIAVIGGVASPDTSVTQYIIPSDGSAPSVTPIPIRADIRRDLRVKFQISNTVFAATGTLGTQIWNTSRAMGSVDGYNPPIQVTAFGSHMDDGGSSLTLALYGADGTTCAVATSDPYNASTSTYVSKGFLPIPGQQEYFAVLTFTPSTDLKQSPIVRRVDFIREGAVSVGASTPFLLQSPAVGTTPAATAVTNYSIAGPSLDPMTETASIGLISLQDGFDSDPLASLARQSGKSMRIEVQYNPADVTQTSTLFLGKMRSLKRKREGKVRRNPDGSVAAFPSTTWWSGQMTLDGLWKRIVQSKTEMTYDFSRDVTTGNPFTVVKLITTLMTNAGGLPPQMWDDGPDYLAGISFQTDPNDEFGASQVEVYTPRFEYALGVARDYLGATIVIDANATNGGGADDKFGCLRLKVPQRPYAANTYLPLAQFVTDATWNEGTIPGGSIGYQKMSLLSYAKYTRADGATVPVCPVLGGTLQDWDEAPEGNCVMVTGTVAQAPGSFSKTASNGKLWSCIHNWPAASFFDDQPIAADPTHQDYTDGSPNLIIVVDPTLNTQGAVTFACRRVFDMACHRRNYRMFEAPLVLVTDPLDGLQVRPRPLQAGDCVYCGNDPWFVNSVTIDTTGERGGSRNASAIYELFQIPELSVSDGIHASVYSDYQQYGPTMAATA